MPRPNQQASRRSSHPFDTIPDLPCRDNPEAFFVDQGGNNRAAKAICRTCPIEVECLVWALENRQHHGVWGGKDETERFRMPLSERLAVMRLARPFAALIDQEGRP